MGVYEPVFAAVYMYYNENPKHVTVTVYHVAIVEHNHEVNYARKTGPLWSLQNVPQYCIVRSMYTLARHQAHLRRRFGLLSRPSLGTGVLHTSS